MPIQLPNLDDRNYDQLVKETEGLIARYFPEYTDVGPADPAVAVNELFCYFFDIVSYQINRVTPETRRNFASLLGIPKDYDHPPEESIGLALAKLSRQNRAVTSADIEAIVIEVSKTICVEPVQRVRVLPGERVRVYVLQPDISKTSSKKRQQQLQRQQDLQRLYDYLRLCGPIGTNFSVENTPYLNASISAEVVKRRDSTITNDAMSTAIQKRIETFLDPLLGGSAGKGMEYGQPLTRGDIYELIEGMPGVDHVKSLYISRTESPEYDKQNIIDLLTPPDGGLIRLRAKKGEGKWVTILGQ